MSVRNSFFQLWKRRASEDALYRVFELTLQYIPCKIVRTSLRWAWAGNSLHTFPNWDEALYDRLGHEGFQSYRQVIALRAKSDDVDIGVDRSQVAWEKYCKSEISCGLQNRAMSNISRFYRSIPTEFVTIIDGAIEIISSVLGEAPSLQDLPARFGPGANVTCKKKTSSRFKLSAQLGISSEGFKAFSELRDSFPRWLGGDREVTVELAEMAEVPKDAKSNRTIEFQPLLNTFVQLGIGTLMKGKLAAAGLNLYTQERNKTLARLGSLDGSLSTVDFESASDSISVRVVELLLRGAPGWFDLLATWRCGHTRARNFSFYSEKFSSMGNGYTFELESLIFWALAKSCVRSLGLNARSVTVYGDDVILPTAAYEQYVALCSSLGFRANRTKSYSSGRFRESCGGDYVLGYDVRPFYIKGRLTTARLVALRNFLHTNERNPRVIQFLDEFLASKAVPYGPSGFGDGHLVTEDRSLYARRVNKNGYSGWTFQTHTKIPAKDGIVFGSLPFDYLVAGYSCYLGADSAPSQREADPHVIRGGERAKVSRIYVLN